MRGAPTARFYVIYSSVLGRVVVFRVCVVLHPRVHFSAAMRAAAVQRAAAAAEPHSAAVAALRALIEYVPDGAARAAARLLLRELAAALDAGPMRGAQPGEEEGAGLTKTRRRRAQRRAALARLCSRSAAHGVGVVSGCGRGGKDKMTGAGVGGAWFQSSSSSVAGATATRGDRSSIATGDEAAGDAEGGQAAMTATADSAATATTEPEEQAAAPAAAPATAEITQTEMATNDEQPASAAPRVAAAAAPHKRQAVAAGTAVGPAVGVHGGKQSPGAIGVAGNIAGDGAAADDCGYRLVVNRRRGACGPKAAKEAAARAPAGLQRVHKGGKRQRRATGSGDWRVVAVEG